MQGHLKASPKESETRHVNTTFEVAQRRGTNKQIYPGRILLGCSLMLYIFCSGKVWLISELTKFDGLTLWLNVIWHRKTYNSVSHIINAQNNKGRLFGLRPYAWQKARTDIKKRKRIWQIQIFLSLLDIASLRPLKKKKNYRNRYLQKDLFPNPQSAHQINNQGDVEDIFSL